MLRYHRQAIPLGNIAEIHQKLAELFPRLRLQIESGPQLLLIDQAAFQKDLSDEFF